MKAVLLSMLLSAATSPQQYMQAGDEALKANNWPEVSANFQSAINTNRLNTAGMAISYWNIHIAERAMNHTDNSMDALLGFIVHGSDFLDGPSYMTYRLAKRFKMKRKLHHAIALIQATWASRNNHSCRSRDFPCYIRSIPLVDVFERTIPFCKDKELRVIKVVEDNSLLRADVTCVEESGLDYENYYFTTYNEY